MRSKDGTYIYLLSSNFFKFGDECEGCKLPLAGLRCDLVVADLLDPEACCIGNMKVVAVEGGREGGEGGLHFGSPGRQEVEESA